MPYYGAGFCHVVFEDKDGKGLPALSAVALDGTEARCAYGGPSPSYGGPSLCIWSVFGRRRGRDEEQVMLNRCDCLCQRRREATAILTMTILAAAQVRGRTISVAPETAKEKKKRPAAPGGGGGGGGGGGDDGGAPKKDGKRPSDWRHDRAAGLTLPRGPKRPKPADADEFAGDS